MICEQRSSRRAANIHSMVANKEIYATAQEKMKFTFRRETQKWCHQQWVRRIASLLLKHQIELLLFTVDEEDEFRR